MIAYVLLLIAVAAVAALASMRPQTTRRVVGSVSGVVRKLREIGASRR